MAVLLAGALAAASLAATPDAAAAAAPVPAGHTASAGGSSAPRLMSAEQAVAQARSTGKPVVASALTTQTAQTTARPNGTLTLTQTAMPTRVFQHGAWANLDPTLKANPNGTLSPAATMNTVILSGGGRAPLASLYTGGQGFTVTLPVALPHPTYSGPIARYADVIPGVDLTVTVQATGAVSDVFTVRTKSAAHDPRLAGLLDATATTTRGLHIAADSSGGLAVADTRGEPLYTAPAPRGWDSAAAPVPAALARSGAAPDPASSADQPGYGAHTAKLKVTTRTSSIALTAPTALLDAPGTKYPVYLDPTYSPSYGKTGWSSPGSGVAGDNYWDGTVDYGAGDSDAEVGNSGDVQGEAMSLFNMPIALSTLRGAKIYSAYFGIVENHSWACPTSGHDQAVDMYAPSGTLTPSNATWNAWVGSLGSAVGAPNSFALGYNSSCPANGIPPFNVTSVVTNDVSSSKATQTLVMRADDHSDNYAFKEFDPNTAQLTVTYDLYPNTPTGLRTSPATNCTNTILGDTSVSLYAAQSTPTRSALTTTFSLYKTSDSAKTNLLTTANGVASDTWQGASGQSAALVLPESFYKARAGGATTSFSFIAQSTDGTLTSGWSKACTFTWDGTRPGAPGVAPNPSPPGGDQTCATLEKAIGTVEPIGTSCSFNLTPPTKNGTAVAVSGYQYQINQSPPARVTATGSPISVPLTHLVNTLTVSAFSAGGNLGAATTVWFDGTALSPAAKDGDLTSDGTPDLIVPGNTGTAFPPGLWLATGNADGSVAKNAVNIGSEGLSVNSDATPADWNGAQAITGNFCGNGAQDVLAYFPTGANPGGGTIACNDGTNGPLHLGATLDTGSAPYQISSGSLTDANGDNATQAVAAGNTSQQNTGLPDLLATIGTQLVLFYSTTPNGYSSNAASFGMCSGGCYVLSNLASPVGTQDWNNWTIATAQLSTGTAMYLWNSTTGALDLWTGLALDSAKTTLTTTSQLTIATGWNTAPASPPQLRAADLSGTGIPTLWTTDTTGTTTATTPATLSNNPALATATTTTTTASHAWAFQDIGSNTAGDPLTSTADRVGSLALTGTTGAVWNTGDPHTPDALLNTASDGITPSGGTGSLAASGNALDLTNSFTISLWADPNATGAAVLSQDGKTDSGITVAPVAAGWSFSLNTGPGTAWSFDSIVGGTVHLGTWTHLTATYDKTTGVMDLYVDDVFVATGTHTAVTTGATGKLQLGDDQHDSTTAHADYYSGRIADVQTWTGTAVPPVQPYTPASYRQPVTATRILDTRSSNANTDGTATVGASTVHGDSVTTLRIANTGVTSPSGTSVTIPASVTAVAIDVTAANETDAGYVTTYADSTQRPLTSSTNFTANTTVTGYQIVPVGADGKIALYTGGSSTATIALIVDLTGYFTSATLTGDQTYTPLGSAVRALDTGSSIAHTTGLSGTGTVAANTAFTLKITDFVPASATAVAINLTTANETGVGYLAAYATGETPAKLTSLTYNTTGPVASMAADTPIGTGGTITILNNGSATDVLVDISGYYTTTTTGQKFHTTNPTRLVHAATDRIPSNGTYTLTTTDTHQITTATTPTLATMLTVHNTTAAGYAVAYPAGPTMPSTSNLNWASGAIAANLALTPTDNNSQIYIANRSSGTADLIIDCSGYFN
jgi:hypothetical protein